MLRKVKYFILGIIFATTVNAAISFADESYFQLKRVDYPIFINGVEVNLESPILNFEGSTYIPLRKVANITGSEVNWDNNSKTVFITNAQKEIIKEVPKEVIKEVIKEVPVEKIVYVTPPLTPTPTPISPITTINLVSDKYEGTIINSRFEGFGKYTWSNGNFYVGEFKNGVMEGKGTTFLADGSIASGNYSKGLLNGYGVLVFSNGAIKGYWENETVNNKQVAFFADAVSNNQNTPNTNITPNTTLPSTQSSNIEMYNLLKERLDKQLASDILTEERNCAFIIKSMKENLNARGIINSSITTDNEKSLIDEKNENISRLKEKYANDLAILKNLYGIR